MYDQCKEGLVWINLGSLVCDVVTFNIDVGMVVMWLNHGELSFATSNKYNVMIIRYNWSNINI